MFTARLYDNNSYGIPVPWSTAASRLGVRWLRDKTTVEWAACQVGFFTDSEMWVPLDGPRGREASDLRRKVAMLLEPRGFNSTLYDYAAEHHQVFEAVLTYDRILLDTVPNARFCPTGASPWSPAARWGIYPKTRSVSIIASVKNFLPGHALRHEIGNRFADRLDRFGHGFGNPVMDKTEALADYRFSVVAENVVEDDFYTEKITDCFVNGTIPVYSGTKNIGKYYDPEGIIQFSTVEEFEEILYEIEHYGKTTYAERLDAVRHNYELATRYTIACDFIADNYPELFA